MRVVSILRTSKCNSTQLDLIINIFHLKSNILYCIICIIVISIIEMKFAQFHGFYWCWYDSLIQIFSNYWQLTDSLESIGNKYCNLDFPL
jgi:hypothetical protein